LNRPNFFPAVGGIGRKLTGPLTLKNQVSRRGEDATVGCNLLLDGPARGLAHRIPCNELSLCASHPFSGFHCCFRSRFAVCRRDINQSTERAQAHWPPVMNRPLPPPALRDWHFDGSTALQINRSGPGNFHQWFGRKQFASLGVKYIEKAVLR